MMEPRYPIDVAKRGLGTGGLTREALRDTKIFKIWTRDPFRYLVVAYP